MIKSITISRSYFIGVIFIILLGLYPLDSFSQDVVIYNVNGERIKGSLVETELTLKTESGEIKIPVSDIALVDFLSNARQVSAKAYLHLLRGRELMKAGFDEEALDELRTAVSQAPQYMDAIFELGKLLQKMGNKSEAIELFARIVNEEPDREGIEIYFKDVADGYLNKKDNGKAADTYLQLFSRYPKDKNAQFAVYKAGFLYAWELKDNKKAISTLESAVNVFPDDQNAEKALYEIGRLYMEEGILDSAENAFNQLISKFPSGERIDNAHFSLASLYRQKNQYGKAVQEIETIINNSIDEALITSAKKLLDELAWNIYGVSDGFPSEDIRCLVMDKDYLWIGTSAGVVKFDTKTNLAIDDVYLWIGTSNSWINQYDKIKGELVQVSLPKIIENKPKILSMCADNNSVWVGTESGIYQYYKLGNDWEHYTVANGLPDSIIVSLASTPKGVWCGALKKGASIFDYSTSKWLTQPKLADKSIPVIVFAGKNIWFAWYEDLRNGVSKYDPISQSWNEWAITEWEADADSTQSDDNTPNVNSSMIKLGAGENEVWVGTDSVTIYYDNLTSQWSQPLNYPSQLLGNTPSSIVVDNDSVWFTTSKGLGRLNKKVLSSRQSNTAGSRE
jgi:tetratricopeptide (TPR) repeat protein